MTTKILLDHWYPVDEILPDRIEYDNLDWHYLKSDDKHVWGIPGSNDTVSVISTEQLDTHKTLNTMYFEAVEEMLNILGDPYDQ